MRKLLWVFLGLLAFALLWWFYFDRLALAAKSWWGRSYLPGISQSVEIEDWPNAYRQLGLATRWAPDDPEVLRAAVDLVKRTGSDPRTMIRFLSRLEEMGDMTVAERCLLGRMHVRLPDLKTAHEIYDNLPQGELVKRHALELLSDIQQAEGLQARSFLTRRQALLADPDDPESVLQLALLDARSGDSSLSGPARERLWPIARKGGKHGLPAIEYLAQHRQLTALEAEELLSVIEKTDSSPSSQGVRMMVLSATMRVSPHRRQEILNKELLRWAGKPPAMLPPLLKWLVAEREFDRLQRIVSAKNAALYGAVLPFYVDALRGQKKWAEVKTLVSGRIDPSFPQPQLRMWLAEAESHLSNDPLLPRQILSSLYDESGRGEDEPIALRTAELSEQLGFWDIARRCYEGAAQRHSQKALPYLLKAYDMASHETNGQAMLANGAKLCELKATDVIFLDRMNYLRLVMGTDIEMAQRSLDEAAMQPQHHIPPDRHVALALLRAMAAYRSGQLDKIPGHLAQVKMIETFPPGPRAVYAGLLAITGDQAGAFRVAEVVPTALLLPEEKRFLQRAL